MDRNDFLSAALIVITLATYIGIGWIGYRFYTAWSAKDLPDMIGYGIVLLLLSRNHSVRSQS